MKKLIFIFIITVYFILGANAQHYVGELYGGGIVYFVYDKGQHGLIASLYDLNGGEEVIWSNVDYELKKDTLSNYDDKEDVLSN